METPLGTLPIGTEAKITRIHGGRYLVKRRIALGRGVSMKIMVEEAM